MLCCSASLSLTLLAHANPCRLANSNCDCAHSLQAEVDTGKDLIAGTEPAVPGTFSRGAESRRSRKPQKPDPGNKNKNNLLGSDLPKKLGILFVRIPALKPPKIIDFGTLVQDQMVTDQDPLQDLAVLVRPV